MSAVDSRVDRIVKELLENPLPKQERMKLLRELVECGEDLPDEMLAEALRRLMERLTD